MTIRHVSRHVRQGQPSACNRPASSVRRKPYYNAKRYRGVENRHVDLNTDTQNASAIFRAAAAPVPAAVARAALERPVALAARRHAALRGNYSVLRENAGV